jgi:hypothetical protein
MVGLRSRKDGGGVEARRDGREPIVLRRRQRPHDGRVSDARSAWRLPAIAAKVGQRLLRRALAAHLGPRPCCIQFAPLIDR